MDVELGSMGRRPRTGSLDQSRPAPAGANAPIKIVVAVDASSGAQTAFVRAVELLEKNRNPNSMLYVLATRALPARWGTVLLQEDSTQSEQERREEDKIRQLLAVYEDQLKSFKFRHRSGISRGDDVGSAICKRVEELKADLLVLGRRNVGTIKRTVTGSVSEYCAANSSVPVLIVEDKD